MFYLPRICEHCLNPSCVASCPSGAMYKRAEDGIVLVDQDQCRGWRMCVTGCPYKKVYFNHRTGKAEKCTFCYPRIEVGLPDRVLRDLRGAAALPRACSSTTPTASPRPRPCEDEHDLYEAQLDLLLDPHDPAVVAAARRDGITEDWIVAAQRSPVYRLAKDYRVALPLHPEFRTMPMVWYVPPLSPVVDRLTETGYDGEDAGNLFGAIDALRIPVEYLAELFTAGDPGPVRGVLQKLAAMRSYMRDVTLDRPRDESIAAAVGMTGGAIVEMYRLLGHRQVRGALRHPDRLRGRLEPRTSSRSSRAASTSTAGPAWSAAGRSARRRADRRRCRWRPSTRCGSGRPATRSPTPAVRRAGQPAQLGRQGPPRRAVPAATRSGPGTPDERGDPPRPRPPATVTRTQVLQAASVCLQYPDDGVLALLPTGAARGRRAAAGGAARERLTAFLDTAAATAPARAGAALRRGLRQPPPLLSLPHVVERRRDPPPRRARSPRSRPATARQAQSSRAPSCPTSCRPSSSSPPPPTSPAASQLLQEHRAGLELLRLALIEAATPYAAPVEAVCALLPGPSPADVAAAKALARSGPPREQVGLDLAPFGTRPAGGPR